METEGALAAAARWARRRLWAADSEGLRANAYLTAFAEQRLSDMASENPA